MLSPNSKVPTDLPVNRYRLASIYKFVQTVFVHVFCNKLNQIHTYGSLLSVQEAVTHSI